MEENQKKEEQKRIARECLRNFGLMDQVQEQFMTESFHRPVEPEPEPVGFWQRMREHWKHG